MFDARGTGTGVRREVARLASSDKKTPHDFSKIRIERQHHLKGNSVEHAPKVFRAMLSEKTQLRKN